MGSVDYSDYIDIASSATWVFALVSDLPGMSRLSPENKGGYWLDGATGPSLGARFKGLNQHRDFEWSTTSTITAFEPPSIFGFRVTYGPLQIADWKFVITSTPRGCRVTESWTDLRSDLLKRDDRRNDYDRAVFTRESIRTTLVRLRDLAEEEPKSATP
jgi:Polyketide cyclase / dehydrase and lipid transport